MRRLYLFLVINFLAINIAMLINLSLNANEARADVAQMPLVLQTPPAPSHQTWQQADQKSEGCISCHTESDSKTMHTSPAVVLGCVDCHGGNAQIKRPNQTDDLTKPNHGLAQQNSELYLNALKQAHVKPLFPEEWNYPSSANPKASYTLLNKESAEFIRFVNPSDYRVARESCGNCHLAEIHKAERSMMATGAMLWGGAAYNNGILPYKNYILGEAYTADGQAATLINPVVPDEILKAQGVLPSLKPLPAWETVKPADVFRVFERGGRNIVSLFPETGIPNSTGQLQRLEEQGRPDIRQSNRGPGTGGRIAVPLINLTKTRLNDPLMWFLGTNDQPGDYRSSGCASCHVVYANDKAQQSSGQYAKFGHKGTSQTVDPTIDKKQSGHPLKHVFSRAIPTSQCMTCHMHQPNMFMNSYLGYTMWDYESDAPHMWPEEQRYPTSEEIRAINERNPEGAAVRGKWSDAEFLSKVSELNDQLSDTQFADYHGHGWNFRAIFKRDRAGNLLDKQGKQVAADDPDKFKKAVHMNSIHAEVGMHCVDCHFSQDNHGNGHLYGEVANSIEINCQDCHGSATEYPNLKTSGPAAPPQGHDLSVLRNPDGQKRFEWIDGKLIQRSLVNPGMEWQVSLVKDSVDPKHAGYNKKAARAKLMSKDKQDFTWGETVEHDNLAHQDEEMECYTCHTSWTTSCGGCHLPIEANWKTERHHYEGGESRNFATYNPQVARNEIFMLGKRGKINGGKIAPTRSTSALILSSTNSNRDRIYIQQPPVAASGFSSQAFNPHFAHTVRKEETKTCSDCHLSTKKDNNAIMAQLLMQGTNFINFVGRYAWSGGAGGVQAIQVTEWEEPQTVYGSYLQRYAYPDFYKQHQQNQKQLENIYEHTGGQANCVQMRGEYLYVAEGNQGFKVYDIANIDNKSFAQRIVLNPFSKAGHDTHIESSNATCMALPTNQPIHPDRNQGDLMRIDNQEQAFHPIYNYAVITDAQEGLILTDVNTLSDGELRNNFLTRALTWNPDGVLNDASHITLAGYYAYITTPKKLVIVNLNKPLQPVVEATVALKNPRATALQFRYLLVADDDGLQSIDVTDPTQPKLIKNNLIPLKNARRIYLARAYAYVAAAEQGLAIVDMENPEALKLNQLFNAKGAIKDAHDVVVATTNASAFAYIADGSAGFKVVQLTSPESQPNFYGFNPEPKPELIAWANTPYPALSLSKGLDRDRGVDENGGQMSVFGRLGSRPLNQTEMEKLYLKADGQPYFVDDEPAQDNVKENQVIENKQDEDQQRLKENQKKLNSQSTVGGK
jgi:hypothetical protein